MRREAWKSRTSTVFEPVTVQRSNQLSHEGTIGSQLFQFIISAKCILGILELRRIPFKGRAITCKNYLQRIYSQHGNFLNAI